MVWSTLGVALSMNDPGWGRNAGQNNSDQRPNPQRPGGNKPEGGPPDLDELWRDFNNRLNRFFGKKNGDGNGSGGASGGGNFKGAGIGAGAIATIFGLLWLSSGFFIIQEGQVGVVLQFGKYQYEAGPGFQWRLPYPLQSHEIVNTSQVRTVEVGYRGNVKSKVLRESLMLTDDENIIDIQFAVQYRIAKAPDYLFNNRNAEESVLQAAETAVREVVGRSKMDYVLYEGREQAGLQVAQLTQQILDRYKVGIQVSSVTVQNAQPPEQVQAAFDDAVKAGQDRERLKNEGQAYANDIIPKAKGASARLLQEAEGYKQKVIATAEGDASRFKSVLVEYNKAPAVTRERLYLDTMQQIFTNVTKVVTDTKQGSQLLYLPLDKLIQATSGADANAKPPVGQTQSGPVADPSAIQSPTAPDTNRPRVNSRSDGADPRMEALRNRDREVR